MDVHLIFGREMPLSKREKNPMGFRPGYVSISLKVHVLCQNGTNNKTKDS